ncbi:bifunctional folylpolyglutamate synthase/dihydrofolate synthase [Parapedobacter lycopersici]|uniref:bifunctional folylpolyglutamate synthase/dihydrofolate synthase n=1 Tax=Parapedobacter lycopersici TaxID=1864939 RepID=UPI00214D513D|nr:folylpolyglutamate synthase/dihydrofolate synthase family protein [Parapedobacter lycopersici]
MLYEEAIDYLYTRLPMFTRDGASAFKKDLSNSLRLCAALGDPHRQFKSIHIAGTNGKGSTSHMLAAILQLAGYKTGLYTSPHLVDFRERIRINGVPIPKQEVAGFVDRSRSLVEEIQPSFFELTMVMAFAYFARENVDIAVVETGLGGRLDSTNIIIPLFSVITNIGYDHMAMLGNTLPEIAAEKAGIIKPEVPVIVGERQEEVSGVFDRAAAERQSVLTYAAEQWQPVSQQRGEAYQEIEVVHRNDGEHFRYALDLMGSYQARNLPGVLQAVTELRRQGYAIAEPDVSAALKQVQQLTGLRGRWETLSTRPLVICDTGHNEDGWREVLANIRATPHAALHLVIGVMRDKDLSHMLPLLPAHGRYYFCQVDMPRALPAVELLEQAQGYGLSGSAFPGVMPALQAAKTQAQEADLIFVGGSTFVVADLLASHDTGADGN